MASGAARWIAILAATSALCVALLFVPHHVRGIDPSGSFTLFEMLQEIAGTVQEGPAAPSSMVFLAAVLALLFTLFFPILFVAMLRFTDSGALYVTGGAIAALGAVAGLIAMIFAQTVVSFGGGGSLRPATVFIWIIPGIQIAFALASIGVGFSNKLAGLAARLVGRV